MSTHLMEIENVESINDDGKVVSVELESGSVVVLPNGDHTITCNASNKSGAWALDSITVELFSR